MTITTHRCQCHELESGLCYPCEVELESEICNELQNEYYDKVRSDWEQLNPPSGSEVWPR